MINITLRVNGNSLNMKNKAVIYIEEIIPIINPRIAEAEILDIASYKVILIKSDFLTPIALYM